MTEQDVDNFTKDQLKFIVTKATEQRGSRSVAPIRNVLKIAIAVSDQNKAEQDLDDTLESFKEPKEEVNYADGNWHALSMTHDGDGNLKAYVDDELVSEEKQPQLTIIHGSFPEQCMEEVNAYLKQGWKLYGPCQIIKNSGYYQALTLNV